MNYQIKSNSNIIILDINNNSTNRNNTNRNDNLRNFNSTSFT